jgi:hypothetical protein
VTAWRILDVGLDVPVADEPLTLLVRGLDRPPVLAGSRLLRFGNVLTCTDKLAYVLHAKRPLVGSRRP